MPHKESKRARQERSAQPPSPRRKSTTGVARSPRSRTAPRPGPAPATTSAPALPASQHREPGRFPIVGIGASAGGLEALEQFIQHVPEGSGMAFVVVQHMDPTHKAMLVELLQRRTQLPVLQAEDRLEVQINHVYVNPPNKDLSLLHGTLHLLPPASPRGPRGVRVCNRDGARPPHRVSRLARRRRHRLGVGLVGLVHDRAPRRCGPCRAPMARARRAAAARRGFCPQATPPALPG